MCLRWRPEALSARDSSIGVVCSLSHDWQRSCWHRAQKGKGKDAALEPPTPSKSGGKTEARVAAAAAAVEPPPAPPPAGGPRGTLIVCPLSVLTNWQMQIQEHTRGGLQARRDVQRVLHSSSD